VTRQGCAKADAAEYARDRYVRIDMTLPPGPSGAPLIGSALDLQRDLLGTLERARHEHGDVVRFLAGPPGLRSELYTFFHPDAVRRVLAGEADRYRKDNRFYQEVRWALGDGLLNSQDERWLRQRRFVQPLFTRKRIAGYADSMADEAADLIARWRPLDGRAVDLHAEMSRLTLRVVGRLLFGSEVEQAVPVVRSAFPIIGDHARRRAVNPLVAPRSWPTRANRRAARAQSDVYGVCDELIAARRARPTGGDDLLSLLIAARDDGEGLDDAEIRDQILIFLLAGHDTTAIALTFALQLLGRHPAVQRRLQREVDDVLGDRTPTAADLEALAYTTMVLKEAMRLYPPAPGLGRRTREGDRIGGFDIPPGADVALFPWVTHRHPDFWPQPTRFDPERFAPAHEAERHRHAYFPFGAGPRACIGQYFSMLEATIVLAMIARRYAVTALSANPRRCARGSRCSRSPACRAGWSGARAGRDAPRREPHGSRAGTPRQAQPIAFSRPAHSCSRRTNFWTFPVPVRGSSQNSTAAGHLNFARFSRQNAISSSSPTSSPDFSSTNAFGRSPHFSSGIATTAASDTASCRASACSTSMLEMFSPPEMMMSFERSRSST
jgi:cytochrome P450